MFKGPPSALRSVRISQHLSAFSEHFPQSSVLFRLKIEDATEKFENHQRFF
jgi:hypothetical protein